MLLVVGLVVLSRVTGWWTPKPACDPDVMCVPAGLILQEYTDDPDAAQVTYGGRSVEISGRLDMFLNDTGDYTGRISGPGGSIPGGAFVGCIDLPYEVVQRWSYLPPKDQTNVMTGVVVGGELNSQGNAIVLLTGCGLKGI